MCTLLFNKVFIMGAYKTMRKMVWGMYKAVTYIYIDNYHFLTQHAQIG